MHSRVNKYKHQGALHANAKTSSARKTSKFTGFLLSIKIWTDDDNDDDDYDNCDYRYYFAAVKLTPGVSG